MRGRTTAAKRRRRERALVEPLESRTLLDATIVGGLPQWPASSNPSELTVSGNLLFFASTAGGFGKELWATDGTTQGTHLVKDINPGIASSNLFNLADVNGLLFFTATDASGQTILWRSDGTAAGTIEIATTDLQSQLSVRSAFLSNLTNVGGHLFFSVNGLADGPELWTSDGTVAGTRQLRQFAGSTTLDALTDVNGAVFFWNDGTAGDTLWKSDGTAAGTVRLGTGSGWKPWGSGYGTSNPPGKLNGTVYFQEGDEMYQSDGTPVGTKVVTTFPGPINAGTVFLNAPGILYFGTGNRVYRTDGTAAGTSIIFNGNAQPLLLVNGAVFLNQVTSTGDSQIWNTDGTPTGTSLVLSSSQLPAPFAGSRFTVSDFTAAGGRGFFLVAPFSSPQTSLLYVSDGTPQGTLALPVPGFPPQFLAGFSGRLYFEAVSSVNSNSLWTSDGTTAGTTEFGPLAPGTAPRIQEIAAAGATLYISNTEPNAPGDFSTIPIEDLWVTSGASSSATHLDISGQSLSSVGGFVPVASNMFFTGDVGTGPNGYYLEVSDGTSAGTHVVGDEFAYRATPFKGSLLFINDNNQLWTSDGHTTRPIVLNLPGNLTAFTPVGSLVFFLGGVAERELWTTDGISPQVQYVATPDPAAQGPEIFGLSALDTNLVFFVQAASGLQLWRSDGTSSGTVMVTNLGPVPRPPNLLVVGNLLFFSLDDGIHGSELWKTDGTAAGTALVADINPGAAGSNPTSFVAYNGRLYFSADDGSHGRELWTSDGTAAGTHLVADVNPGPGGSSPSAMAVAGGLLYFNAFTPQYGNELWSSDGTAGGTSLVQDLYPGPGSSDPRQLTDADGSLYFIASDPTHQNALWKLPVGGTIEGSVFNDANHNGAEDAGEAGLAGRTVYLDANHNGSLDVGEASTVTDSTGRYQFSDLRPGSFTVRQVTPAGYGLTAPQPAATSFALGAGQDVSLSFGDVTLASVPLDFGYLLALAQHYDRAGTFIDGDANGDDTINFTDLLLVAQNYGHPLPSAPATIAPVAGATSVWAGPKLIRRPSRVRLVAQ